VKKNGAGKEIFLFFQNICTSFGARPAELSMDTDLLSLGKESYRGMKSTINLDLMLRLRMNGAMPLFFLNVFMVRKRKILLF
jgi:hypothetical protein